VQAEATPVGGGAPVPPYYNAAVLASSAPPEEAITDAVWSSEEAQSERLLAGGLEPSAPLLQAAQERVKQVSYLAHCTALNSIKVYQLSQSQQNCEPGCTKLALILMHCPHIKRMLSHTHHIVQLTGCLER
jgi:hypothetical protein